MEGKSQVSRFLGEYYSIHQKKNLGKTFLNFTCRLLNIAELNISAKAGKLVTAPVLLILQQVWKLDERAVKRFFILGKNLPLKNHKKTYDESGRLCQKKRSKIQLGIVW